MFRKLGKTSSFVIGGVAAICLFLSNGCGSGNSANVITVTVTSSGNPLILGQSANLTATVTGGTTGNSNVNWEPCQYTTTTTNSNGTTKTNAAVNCPSDGSLGTLTNEEATGTATFNAPSSLPSPTTFPGLIIIITAQSQQNTSKTGTVSLTIISGITATLTPQSASVPLTEVQQFSVLLTNDLKNQGVTWSLTQNNPFTNSSGTSLTYPQLATCSPTCGSIAPPDPNNPNVALYTAPSTIPSAITPAQTNNTNCPQNVTVVATSVADPTEFTTGTVTMVQAGPITFNGITPTIAPAGATLWDIYLNAPGISSSSVITLTPSGGQPVAIPSSSGQIKVLFPLPPPPPTTTTTNACTVTNPTSTGARLRLTEANLGLPGSVTISVSDPKQTVTQSTTGTFTFNIIPVRPTSIASTPDDVVQNATTPSQTTPVTIDGGYFGPASSNPLTAIFFDGLGLPLDPNRPSSSRQLNSFIQSNQINTGSPGLYTLSVASRATPLPIPNNSSVTNIAVFPDYSANPPTVTASAGAIPAGTNPSAIDIDSTLGVVVVAETGSNAVQFFTIGQGTLTPIDSTGATCTTACSVAVGKIPTNLSVNRVNHTVAVVNYGDQTVTVLPIPVPGAATQNPAPGTPFTLDISGALQGAFNPASAPIPYSIGVDPDSNLALVAYSSTSALTTANLGIVVNLNPNVSTSPYGCILGQSISSSSNQFGQCIFAQVSLNNGAYPQIAMTPHGHLALVTPGGSGVVQGVDVTRKSTANIVKSATLTGGLVTVTIDTTQIQNSFGAAPTSCPTSNPCSLMMVPGNAGTVTITNMTPTNSANKALFNGVFPVNVLSNNSFSYSLPSNDISITDTATGGCTSSSATPPNVCAEVFYGAPDQTFPMTPTAQGVAINSVTHTAAVADAEATGTTNGSQIWLLNSLDQSVTSFPFSATCTAFNVPCATTPEFLATTDVAWQPYTNELVSYNPGLNGINVNQVSISDPVSHQRYGFACEVNNATKTGAGTACITNPNTAPTTVCPSLSACQQMFLNQITLQGVGAAKVQNGTNTLQLFGGLAVDPVSNQAFVVMSGSGNIDVVNLTGSAPVKPLHVSEVIVPSPNPGPGVIGGVPNGLVPQATLTSTSALTGVQIFGTGFDSTTQVLLDGTSITSSSLSSVGSVQVNSPRQLTATIPTPFLGFPHHYALTLTNSAGVQSNAVDFIVVQAVNLSQVCTNTTGATTMPTSVAIADQLVNGPFSPLALISVTGCNSVVALDINPTVNGLPNPHLGQMYGPPVAVGTNPQGIAISEPLGLAVVANNGSNTTSILDLTPLAPCAPVAVMPSSNCSPVEKIPDVSVGTNPTGVAINDETGIALVANTGSNTVSSLNLATLFANGSTAAVTSLTPITIGGVQQPLAVAIDPDCCPPNDQGIAVVTSVALSAGSAPTGSLAVVDIGTTTPVLSTTVSSGFVSGTPTGVVFDPAVATGTTNPGVFFANSSGTNTITEFNPNSGGGSSVSVGINPTSLAVNPQTGAILTSNTSSNTISIVDTLSNPFRTVQTLGFPGSPTFGVAIDQFTNLAVIVDQANSRVFLFPMPN